MLCEKKYACAVLFARFSNAVRVNNVKSEKFNASASNNNFENSIACVFNINYLNICFMLNRETVISLHEINSLSWTMIWLNVKLLFLFTLKTYARRLRISASIITTVLWKNVCIKKNSSTKRLHAVCFSFLRKYYCVQCSRISNCAQYINVK